MRTLFLLALVACTRDASKSHLDTASVVEDALDADADGFSTAEGDCDDGDASVHPGAEERCDGNDQDCDGAVDEDVVAVWYTDADGDGFGDAARAFTTCEPPQGTVTVAGDCDDGDDEVFPGAFEACDGEDDDCDGAVDEEGVTRWYRDADGDGYGDPATGHDTCAPVRGDVVDATDCDDAVLEVHPDAPEACDEVDNDCDGVVDDGVTTTFWADLDGDGHGNAAMPQDACVVPTGYASDAADCDDANAAVSPSAVEICNAVDDDCDGVTDEDDAADALTWYADVDADGHGDPAAVFRACEAPSGTSAAGDDCDDTRADVSPSSVEVCGDVDEDCDGLSDESSAVDAQEWFADDDADGFGDAGEVTLACEMPAGFVGDATDCDDTRARVSPAGIETCDGLDDDCDGTVDEDDAIDAEVWYADADRDRYGDASVRVAACSAPAGFVAIAADCDDTRAASFPGGTELCNGHDDDCDGNVDESAAIDASTFYADADRDGYGNAAYTTRACAAPSGYVADAADCNDLAAAAHPGGTERCDGLDNDCDASVDEASAVDATSWFLDADADGYGDASTPTVACSAPFGYVAVSSDCDDTRAFVSPAGLEVCDGLDDDCDGTTDEAASVDAPTWYADGDADGYGRTASTTRACTLPSGYAALPGDCDDAAASTFPGGTERCNGADDDCDGTTDEASAVDASAWYSDRDGDGFGAGTSTRACSAPAGHVASASDCDDTSASVSPAGTERCNGVDDDCDGSTDETSAVDASTWYADADADGHGGSSSTRACAAPSGYLATSTDCNDGNAAISPSDPETCNSVDDDCDGATDEAGSTGERTWYRDADGDGYGSSATTTSRCSAPAGYVSSAGDCDDARAAAYPGAVETCNGADDDCDGTADEGFGARCESLACTGSGLIQTIPDGCINDGGGSSGGDALQVYCVNNIARFCLSGEACPWRSSPTFDDGSTCERSGLGSDYMANAWCSQWNGYGNYYCTSSEDVYFP